MGSTEDMSLNSLLSAAQSAVEMSDAAASAAEDAMAAAKLASVHAKAALAAAQLAIQLEGRMTGSQVDNQRLSNKVTVSDLVNQTKGLNLHNKAVNEQELNKEKVEEIRKSDMLEKVNDK